MSGSANKTHTDKHIQQGLLQTYHMARENSHFFKDFWNAPEWKPNGSLVVPLSRRLACFLSLILDTVQLKGPG